MERNTYLNVVATLLLGVTIFFGIQILSSLDKSRFLNEKIVAGLSDLNIAQPSSPILAHTAGSEDEKRGAFANSEFFAPDAVEGDRLIEMIASDIGNLNPLVTGDADVAKFRSLVNSSLAERNYGNPEKIEPVLVENWEVSDDNLTYRIKLRDNIFWHDFIDKSSGKTFKNVKVTADDFKFFVDVIKNEKVNCAPIRNMFGAMESLEVVNEREFVVKWNEPYFRIFELTMALEPLPRHYYLDSDGAFDPDDFNDNHVKNSMMIGCGPYKLLKYDKSERIVFERNDRYIGRRHGVRPSLKYIIFEMVPHPNTSFQMLLSKQIDRMRLTAEQWMTRTGTPEFSEDGFLRKFENSQMAYGYIAWNMNKKLFANAKVRNAMTMLVDREKILNDVYFNLGKIQTGPFYMESPACDPEIKPLPFDVAAAGKLLKEEGWTDSDNNGILDKDGEEFDFVIIYPADAPNYERILTIIKEGMAKAGINMRMQAFEWSVFLQKVDNREFDSYTMGWQLDFESDPYQLWHSSQADVKSGSNFVGFKNNKADELIENIRRELNSEKRAALCREFHQLIHREQPYTFLIAPNKLEAISKRYNNFRIFPMAAPSDILWTPKAEQLLVPNI